MVVFLHNPRLFSFHPQRAYLAVDLFFAISGFVLSHVYGDRIDQGWALQDFLKTRVLRLAPLHVLALVFSAAVLLADKHSNMHQLGLRADLIYLSFGLLLLPSHLSIDPQQAPFPYNNVAWTLFLELVMNVVHCSLLRRIGSKSLISINLVSATALLVCCHHYRYINGGWQCRQLMTLGLSRAFFSYTAGMLLYRGWKRGVLKLRVPSWLLLLVAGSALSVPIRHGLVVAVVFVVVLFPLLVLFAAYNEPGNRLAEVMSTAGAASYPIYVLHGPSFALAHLVLPERLLRWPNVGYPALVLLFGLALLLEKVYDAPLRKALKRVELNLGFLTPWNQEAL